MCALLDLQALYHQIVENLNHKRDEKTIQDRLLVDDEKTIQHRLLVDDELRVILYTGSSLCLLSLTILYYFTFRSLPAFLFLLFLFFYCLYPLFCQKLRVAFL